MNKEAVSLAELISLILGNAGAFTLTLCDTTDM